MKERPILFNSEMVRAILDGRKTQTRRAVKLKNGYARNGADIDAIIRDSGARSDACPYGKVGDRLWVRETHYEKGRWVRCSFPDADSDDIYWSGERIYIYAATDEKPKIGYRTWPSIHMKRTASRITLEITNVRVERLQDISRTDAIAEGVDWKKCPSHQTEESYRDQKIARSIGMSAHYTAEIDYVAGFRDLWNSINGNWNENPWVWVIEFKKI